MVEQTQDNQKQATLAETAGESFGCEQDTVEQAPYSYKLPDRYGQPQVFGTNINSVVIMGSNGAGKSRLGDWMERQADSNLYRISAQRSLTVPPEIPHKSFDNAYGDLFDPTRAQTTDGRYKYDDIGKAHSNGLTIEIRDFDTVLALVLAMVNKEKTEFLNRYNKALDQGVHLDERFESVADRLVRIWNTVLLERDLIFEGEEFRSRNPMTGETYSAKDMSDGERSVLYLIAQVLIVEDGKTILLDEPDLHLHPSIIGRLWSELESERPECLFIYITHNPLLATMHRDSDIVWVKGYDGTNWTVERIHVNGDEADRLVQLPDDLLYQLLGNKQSVIFIEGGNTSHDLMLYSLLMPGFLVIPCGSCNQVISYTKTYNGEGAFGHIRAFGIIDRDFREQETVDNLRKSDIYCIDLAHVENIYLMEPVLELMKERVGGSEKNGDEIDPIMATKDFVIEEFRKDLDRQVLLATREQIGSLLRGGLATNDNEHDSSCESIDDCENADDFQKLITRADWVSVSNRTRELYQDLIDQRNYIGILRHFKHKGLLKQVGAFFGLSNGQYANKVRRFLQQDESEEARDQIRHNLGFDPIRNAHTNEYETCEGTNGLQI